MTSSSETLICKCGRIFNTVENLYEFQKSEDQVEKKRDLLRVNYYIF